MNIDKFVASTKKPLRRNPLPVTLHDWHRALGFHKCANCGVPIGNGIPFVWQGRNRWCEECFWDEDGESAISDELTDFESPKKENPNVNHGSN